MSENTALATYDNTAALANYGTTGLVNEDFVLKPEDVELVQPIQTAENESLIAGRFRGKQSNMQFQKMTIVPLEFGNGRSFFGDQEDRKNAKPICRSIDGKLPIINNPDLIPQCNNCKSCPKAQWSKVQRNGKSVNVKPECAENVRFLFLDAETGFPYRMNFKRTGVPIIRALRETLYKLVMMSKAKGKIIPHFGFQVEMSPTKVQGSKGTYYIVSFSAPKPIADPAQFGPLYERLVLRRGADDEAEQTTQEADSAINDAVDQEYVEG